MLIHTLDVLPLAGFFFAWSYILLNVFKSHQIFLRQNPLRRARWRMDVCTLILCSFIVFPTFLLSVYLFVVQPQKPETKTEQPPQTLSILENSQAHPNEKMTHHPAIIFLARNTSVVKLIFMYSFAAILVPIQEEFVFRLMIQGWLDAREREIFRGRRGNGWRAVVLTALLFSLLHFRRSTSEYPSEQLLGAQYATMAFAAVFVLTLGFWLLHHELHLTWREIGLDFRFWKKDLFYGFIGVCATAQISYLILKFLSGPLKEWCSPDFLALIPISLAFGFLYWRTRRLLPGITAHALFNGISVIKVFLLCVAS